MSKFDQCIARQLDEAIPAPDLDLDGGWSDVLRRAQPNPKAAGRGLQRRSVQLVAVLAMTLVLLVPGVAGAAAGLAGELLNGFRDWLGMGPGRAAPAALQRSFANANSMSIVRFPSGTQLHFLLSERIGTLELKLLGFRARGSLCLQLRATGVPSEPVCTPLGELESSDQPVHLLLANQRDGRWTINAGLATDAVRRVDLVTNTGWHPARLADNAFLFVSPAREQALGAVAIDSLGNQMPIALTSASGARPASVSFQSTPDLRLDGYQSHDTLNWVVQERPLGAHLAPSAVIPLLAPGTRVLFARLITPQESGFLRVGVALVSRAGHRKVCAVLYQPMGSQLIGCDDPADLFSRGWIVGRALSSPPDSTQAVLVGLAAPDVSQLDYLVEGTNRPLPLLHGVFAITLPTLSYPVQISVYKRQGPVQQLVEQGLWPLPAHG